MGRDKGDGCKNSSSYIQANGSYYKVGRFYGNKNGEGKVIVSSSLTDSDGKYYVAEDTYFIGKGDVNLAIDSDIVLIDVGKKKNDESHNARVVSILSRDLKFVAGEVVKIGVTYFLNPVDKRFSNLTITLNGEVEDGEKVLVEITPITDFNQYSGSVVHTYNKDWEKLDISWEAAKHGIIDKFSDESITQAEEMPKTVLEKDKIGRMDLTSWEIFTIDGADTKDIDDAVSCRKLENGNYLVGVHIADVSHYVKEGSPLDKDAFKRGTSVYLGGQVIPMLPYQLSNGICSLNPNVERLAMSCIMEIDGNGNVVGYNIWESVIKSCLKMTYAKVNSILKDHIIDEEYREHADTLRDLNRVALLLRKKRILEGAVEFDRPELRIKGTGEGTDVSVRTQDVAEGLIGEFMIVANETVDKHLTKLGFPCLHRVHDKPNVERLSEFLNTMNTLGISYGNFSADSYCSSAKSLQQLSDYVKSLDSTSDMLSANLIRCMSRARYSPINIGHSGLAKTNYCHFTSPIRRYPDLIIHRIVKDSLFDKEHEDENKQKWNENLSDIGQHCSKMERLADDAERSVLYIKCIEYMEEHIGEDFDGTVIGLSNKGLNIQLDNYIEGRVRIAPGEYVFDQSTLTLESADGRTSYHIGDRLSLKVIEANLDKRTIGLKVNSKGKQLVKTRNNGRNN